MGCLKLDITNKNPLLKVAYSNPFVKKKTVQRFLSVDPLTKSYPELTPYQFASNRPIAAIDLDGLEAKDLYGELDPVRRNLAEQRKNGTVPPETPQERNVRLFVTGGLGFVVAGGFYGLVQTFPALGVMAAEEVIERVTGIPVIANPIDVIEFAAKKGVYKGLKKFANEFEKRRIAESLADGKKIEQIERGIGKTAGVIEDGKVVEFKALTERLLNPNTAISKLKDATKKEGVEILDLDIRFPGGSKADAQNIFTRFSGTKERKAFKGEVRIATDEGLVTFPGKN